MKLKQKFVSGNETRECKILNLKTYIQSTCGELKILPTKNIIFCQGDMSSEENIQNNLSRERKSFPFIRTKSSKNRSQCRENYNSNLTIEENKSSDKKEFFNKKEEFNVKESIKKESQNLSKNGCCNRLNQSFESVGYEKQRSEKKSSFNENCELLKKLKNSDMNFARSQQRRGDLAKQIYSDISYLYEIYSINSTQNNSNVTIFEILQDELYPITLALRKISQNYSGTPNNQPRTFSASSDFCENLSQAQNLLLKSMFNIRNLLRMMENEKFVSQLLIVYITIDAHYHIIWQMADEFSI